MHCIGQTITAVFINDMHCSGQTITAVFINDMHCIGETITAVFINDMHCSGQTITAVFRNDNVLCRHLLPKFMPKCTCLVPVISCHHVRLNFVD